MARSPRQPKGPSLRPGWLRDRESARAFLEKERSKNEIAQLVQAGEVGLYLAEVFEYLYPYRDWIVGKRGALGQQSTKVPDLSFSNPDYKDEIDYSDVLAGRVNPQGVHLGDGHQRLSERSALAPLSALGEEALQFMGVYSSLRVHAERLRRALLFDPRMMKWLDTMRSRRQMFCACILIFAKKSKLTEPTSGQLAALALQTDHEEFQRDRVSSADDTHGRLRAWDEEKREVKKGLAAFLAKLVETPLNDPEDGA